MPKFIDLTGKKFGRLTVIKKSKNKYKDKQIMWICRCDCGEKIEVIGNSLVRGNTKSCGCLRKELAINNISNPHITHRMSQNRIYRIYIAIKQRCYNSKHKEYKNYGERGIVLCEEWLNDFMNFYNWAVDNGYSDTLSIDRKDVNGIYEPDNCKWSNDKEQSNNKRNNRYLTINGETKTISQWADCSEVSHQTIRGRLNRGWEVNEKLLKKLK